MNLTKDLYKVHDISEYFLYTPKTYINTTVYKMKSQIKTYSLLDVLALASVYAHIHNIVITFYNITRKVRVK